MTIATHGIFDWPAVPPLPPPGEPVVVRVATASVRAIARKEVRDAARAILAAWAGLPPDAVALHESAQGPTCAVTLHGHGVRLSFSYCEDAGWIAMVRGADIGIDALRAQDFAEMSSVATCYLGPDVAAEVGSAADPARAFARAWTALEARLKLTRRALREWHEGTAEHAPTALRKDSMEHAGTVVTWVTSPTG